MQKRPSRSNGQGAGLGVGLVSVVSKAEASSTPISRSRGHQKLAKSTARVLAAIRSAAGTDGISQISYREISRAAGIERRLVCGHIAKLERLGLVQVTRGQRLGVSRNVYQLLLGDAP